MKEIVKFAREHSGIERNAEAAILVPGGVEHFFRKGDWDALKSIIKLREAIDPWGFSETDWLAYLESLESEILITGWQSRPLPKTLRSINPRVKYICHLTGEVKYFLPEELISEGLLVSNWGGAISPQVAEAALMLVLACLRNLYQYQDEIHNHKGWNLEQSDLSSLFNKKVGIHGFGQVARSFINLIQPWEPYILAYSDGVPDELYDQYKVKRAGDLIELFEECDIVVELEALTDKSKGSVTEAHLRSLGEKGVFVNVGRGPVVDEQGLISVSMEGKLRIGLDVYWNEPLPVDYPLRGLKNVILLPHVAGPTPDYLWKCGNFALENIRRYLAGDAVNARISPERYTRIT